MKKGQVEGIGLVIIVLLVLIGLFFALTNHKPEDSPLETYSDDKLATNFLTTMLETNTLCGPTLVTLASDCAKERAGRVITTNCGDPCDYIAPIITDLMNKTFIHQGYNYAFEYVYTYGTNEEILLDVNTGCTNQQAQAARGYYDVVIHPVPGTATMTFSLCT